MLMLLAEKCRLDSTREEAGSGRYTCGWEESEETVKKGENAIICLKILGIPSHDER